jgi:DNA polymerase III subunit delta
MLIFVYGDDTFSVQEKVVKMRSVFRKKFDPSGMNIAEFLDGNFVAGEILGAARSLPFLGEKRMVVVRDFVSSIKKSEMRVWVEGFSSTPESSIVIFWETTEPKLLEKKPLFKALRDIAEVHDYAFPKLQGVDLNHWVLSRIKMRGGITDSGVVRVLIERVGADLWQMDHEVHKLVAYASGEPITRQMVDTLVHASFEGKIFDMIDAIAQKRIDRALQLLQEERWSGANNHYLLTMLGRQVRILLGARAMLNKNPKTNKQEMADVLGVHPFVAQKALAQARGFSLETLKEVHKLVFVFDRDLKRGQIDSAIAVDLVAASLLK